MTAEKTGARFVYGLFDRHGSLCRVVSQDRDPADELYTFYRKVHGQVAEELSVHGHPHYPIFTVNGTLVYRVRPIPTVGKGAVTGLLHLHNIGWVAAVCTDTDIPALVKMLTGYTVEVRCNLSCKGQIQLMVDGRDSFAWLGFIETLEL